MPNTALNRTVATRMQNKSGGALGFGAVVILDNANALGFTTTTSAGLATRQVGVIIEPDGIANDAFGMVATAGWVPQINLDGAATVGQFIQTDTVAGQGTPHDAPQDEGDFAVALQASATPEAILFGSPNQPGGGGGGGNVNAGGTLDADTVILGDGSTDVKSLPNGSEGEVLTIVGGVPAYAPSGGGDPADTIITPAAYASIPAAGTAGRLFLPTNSFYQFRDSGSVWVPWGPIFPMTPPVDGDFSWVNQGSATVVTTNGGIYLQDPGTSGGNWRLRVKSAPSTPYMITVAVLPNFIDDNSQRVAVGFRQSSDGKLALFVIQADGGGRFYSQKWNSPSSFNSNYAGSPAEINANTGPFFLRIADNGTNRILSASRDGQNFIQFHSVGRTDFLTADQVCFGVDSVVTTYACGMTLLSWVQA